MRRTRRVGKNERERNKDRRKRTNEWVDSEKSAGL